MKTFIHNLIVGVFFFLLILKTAYAKEIVCGTDSPKGADKWIYITDSGKGADKWWIVTDNINVADIIIQEKLDTSLPWYYFTDSAKGADVWVFITDSGKSADKWVYIESQSLKNKLKRNEF